MTTATARKHTLQTKLAFSVFSLTIALSVLFVESMFRLLRIPTEYSVFGIPSALTFWWKTFAVPYAPLAWDVKLKLAIFQFYPVIILVMLSSLAIKFFFDKKAALIRERTSPVYVSRSALDEFCGKDGLQLSQTVRLSRTPCFEHALVVGPTGSGKTVSYFLPNLFLVPEGVSAVVTDPKGELYRTTAPYLRSRGYVTRIIKLDNASVSELWNPFDFAQDSTSVAKLAQSFISNASDNPSGDRWDTAAENVLISLIYIARALSPSHANLGNAHKLAIDQTFDALYGLSHVAAARLKTAEPCERLKGLLDGRIAEETQQSIKFVANNVLQVFFNSEVSAITAKSTVDFSELKLGSNGRPVVLYVSVPEERVKAFRTVLATLYMQIFDSVIQAAEVNNDRPVFFLLDEFANIGKIVGFESYIATIRSRKMSVSACLQSIEQLVRVYGDAAKREITNNLKSMLVLPGLKEIETLKYISDVAGKVAYESRDSVNSDLRVMEKDRVPVNAIRELEDNQETGIHEAIIMLKNKPPYKDQQCRHYRDARITPLLRKFPPLKILPKMSATRNDEIRSECFFSAREVDILSAAGHYICYEGDIAKCSPDNRTRIAKQFESLLQMTGGPPRLAIVDGDLRVDWSPADTTHAAYVQEIITEAYQFKFDHGTLDSLQTIPTMSNDDYRSLDEDHQDDFAE